MAKARPRWLLRHCVCWAKLRAFSTAGTSKLTNRAIMATTTSSSINVKPRTPRNRPIQNIPPEESRRRNRTVWLPYVELRRSYCDLYPDSYFSARAALARIRAAWLELPATRRTAQPSTLSRTETASKLVLPSVEKNLAALPGLLGNHTVNCYGSLDHGRPPC